MDWQRLVYVLPGILLGLTVHEYCHAFSAWKLGDSTARNQGRLTLNPLKHIDPIGFLFLLFAGFGWAKPVQFDPYQLRNLRRDKAIIAAAGPLSNLVLGILLIFGIRAIIYFQAHGMINIPIVFLNIMLSASTINFALFIFNLIPIPPLDGSHILFSALDLKPQTENMLLKIGMPILLVILLAQNFAHVSILPIGNFAIKMRDFFFSI